MSTTAEVDPAQYIDEVNARIVAHGYEVNEGSASVEEIRYLARTAMQDNIKLVAETGFHLGYSSYAFLAANSEAHVVSFDLGEHPYIHVAKELIDELFPDRHTLILGDSRETVPAYKDEHPESFFDLVFVDGGHSYKVAKSDIANFRAQAHSQTIIVMDDLIPWKTYGVGPTLAWKHAKLFGQVAQEEVYKDGKQVALIIPPGRRAWARGRYLLKS